MPDFTRRSLEPELMDAPGVPVADMRVTLDELAVINSLLGGYSVSLDGLDALLPDGCHRVRILDVGTGGGDTPRRIVRWAARRGIEATVLGVDLSPAAIGYALEHGEGYEGLEFQCADVHHLRVTEPFDIVHAALTLHHFDDERAVHLLRTMSSLARWGIVINDLQRHPIAYYSIAALTRCLSKSRLIRNDAPLSVLRAFKRRELVDLAHRAGLETIRLSWRWAFRWQLVLATGRVLRGDTE